MPDFQNLWSKTWSLKIDLVGGETAMFVDGG
jgi:hypothetical protein